ncbi:hypothetical protein LY76DRAFT_182050 [Colletotrichum caudatum]|nr:hypothetical protein LY76DRAFT_182050 [Colletotrichum caudatum]
MTVSVSRCSRVLLLLVWKQALVRSQSSASTKATASNKRSRKFAQVSIDILDIPQASDPTPCRRREWLVIAMFAYRKNLPARRPASIPSTN